MIQLILSVFKPFRRFIELMGADYDQFISILKLKLTLDNRRPRGIGANRKKKLKNSLLLQSLFQAGFGLLFSSLLLVIQSTFTFFFMIHLFIMVMMALMIIMEFTTILFDTSENSVIHPLPVSGNTISLARNAHVFVYLGMIAFNFSIAALVMSVFKFGFISGLLFLVTIPLNVLFTLFFSNILYLGIMRIASGERLKNILMYFQVVIVIFFMAAYQFGLNMVDKTVLADMVLTVHWYSFLFPPILFSGFIEGVSLMVFDTNHLIFIAGTLVVPILSVYTTGKYLTPIFNRKLMDLDQGDRSVKIKTGVENDSSWYKVVSKFFVSQDEEKAAFRLMWKIVGREREFKQAFLPSVGYMVIIVVLQFVRKPVNMDKLVNGEVYLFILYAFAFVAATVARSLMIGNTKHIEWMFKSAPVKSPAVFFKGCIKAAFARFLFPIYIVLPIGLCFIWPPVVLLDVFISLQAVYMISLLIFYSQDPYYPFTQSKGAAQGGSKFFQSFGVLFLSVIIGIIHWQIMKINWFYGYPQLLLIPVYIGATLYIDKKVVDKKISWKKVNLANQMA